MTPLPCIECGDDATLIVTRVDRDGGLLDNGPEGMCAGCARDFCNPRGTWRFLEDVRPIEEAA